MSYKLVKDETELNYQINVITAPWIYSCFSNIDRFEVDGRVFSYTTLRDFDLQICRCSIYNEEYMQRKGGKSVLKAYLEGDESERVRKYYGRLNKGHFSMDFESL